jgi:hypothetical protein
MKTSTFLHPTLLLGLLVLSLATFLVAPGNSAAMAPLARYQTTGPSVPMYFQRINNTSFETGLQPWAQSAYNNYTSRVRIVSPGFGDSSAVQLMINSGNLTVDSHLFLIQDFSKNAVGFRGTLGYGVGFVAQQGNSVRLRVAVQVQALQGNSATDRVEVSVTLTSSGTLARIHYVVAGSSIPSNTTSDAYLAITGSGASGWIVLDRDVASDAVIVFPALYTNCNPIGRLCWDFSSIKDAMLSVYSTSQSKATYDPRIKYYETGGDSYWNTTETVVFDPDADGVFNAATDTILYNRGISNGTTLSNDMRIKYVDANLNGRWDPGEPIVYDLKNEGIYDIAVNDPVIQGTPIPGSLLQTPIRKQTTALFDQVELYSPTGNYNWVHNGGFESGTFEGWGNTAGFALVTGQTVSHSGVDSALGVAAGTSIGLAQSIDAKPAIDNSTILQASSYIDGMTGGSSSDKIDVWLGLVDSSPSANPLSIYYYFRTGTGLTPANTTDTVNHKAPGFGSFLQWLSVNQSLLPETRYFNLTGYTAPYRLEAVVLEVSAQPSSTTTAHFDDISILSSYNPEPALSTYYAVDSLNSTYVYSANKVPQGSFYLSVPGGQSVLNITSPAGVVLLGSDYTTQTIAGAVLITVPTSTSLKYSAFGNWMFYTTSRNALAFLYATTTGSNTATSNFSTGTSVNFVSRSEDPMGSPLFYSNVTFILHSSTTQILPGRGDLGWFNATNVTLPSSPGTVTLEAITVSSSYIGLRTYQLAINSTIPWALIAYISIAAGAAIVFSLLLFMRRRRKTAVPTPSTSPLPNNGPKQPQTRPQKGKQKV